MPEKLYTIDSIIKRSILTPAGQFRDVYEVSFITKSGVRDTINVPEGEYTPENVKKIVSEKAERHEKTIAV